MCFVFNMCFFIFLVVLVYGPKWSDSNRWLLEKMCISKAKTILISSWKNMCAFMIEKLEHNSSTVWLADCKFRPSVMSVCGWASETNASFMLHACCSCRLNKDAHLCIGMHTNKRNQFVASPIQTAVCWPKAQPMSGLWILQFLSSRAT